MHYTSGSALLRKFSYTTHIYVFTSSYLEHTQYPLEEFKLIKESGWQKISLSISITIQQEHIFCIIVRKLFDVGWIWLYLGTFILVWCQQNIPVLIFWQLLIVFQKWIYLIINFDLRSFFVLNIIQTRTILRNNQILLLHLLYNTSHTSM